MDDIQSLRDWADDKLDPLYSESGRKALLKRVADRIERLERRVLTLTEALVDCSHVDHPSCYSISKRAISDTE